MRQNCADSKIKMIQRIIDICASKQGAHVASFEFYIDESESQKGQEVFCLGGVVYETDKAKEMNIEWQKFLDTYKIEFFRMTSCASGSGPFIGKKRDIRLLAAKAAVKIINKYALCTVSVVFSKLSYAESMPNNNYFKTPISFSYYTAVTTIAELLGDQDTILFLIENGHPDQDSISSIFNDITKNDQVKKRLKYNAHAFINKKDCGNIQSADLIAWANGRIGEISINKNDDREFIEAIRKEISVKEIVCLIEDKHFPKINRYLRRCFLDSYGTTISSKILWKNFPVSSAPILRAV